MQTQLKDESLERIRDQAVDLARKEGIDIFYSESSEDDNGHSFSEIQWQNSHDWRDFIALAKSQGVKLLILEESILKMSEFLQLADELNENGVEDDVAGGEMQSVKDLVGRMKRFSKYDGKLGNFKIGWMRDSAKYLLSLSTKWYDEMQELVSPFLEEESPSKPNLVHYSSVGGLGIEPKKPLPKELARKSVDEIVDEVLSFLRDEYGDAPDYPNRTALDIFWESKGIQRWEVDPKARLLMDRVDEKVGRRLQEERQKKENDRIPDIIQDCVEWAKENRFTKLTKSNLKAFLAEKTEQLTKNSEDIILLKVNLDLRD